MEEQKLVRMRQKRNKADNQYVVERTYCREMEYKQSEKAKKRRAKRSDHKQRREDCGMLSRIEQRGVAVSPKIAVFCPGAWLLPSSLGAAATLCIDNDLVALSLLITTVCNYPLKVL